jgi:polyphosphate kinase
MENEIINRDISWLSFNERVLQEAIDPDVPLLERIKFLGIFSNNRDEFFRVRVATIKRMINIRKRATQITGDDPTVLLHKIQKIVIKQQKKFEETYREILKELEKEKIFIITETQLSDDKKAFVKSYFSETVRPNLVPIMLDKKDSFPYLKDKATYLIIKLTSTKEEEKSKFALLEVPSDVISRFLVLPEKDGVISVMLLDDVIRLHLKDIFSIFPSKKIEAYNIKLTRDAELDIDVDINESLIDKISNSIKKRKKADAVRFVYDQTIDEETFSFLKKKLKLSLEDNLIPGGRYHNFKNFMDFPHVGGQHLRYQPLPPVEHPDFIGKKSIFSLVGKKDVLIAYPYQTINHIIDFLREAAIDPNVISIKINIYRAAKNSKIVNALMNAVKNGKNVTVVIELEARFDEENNIKWAKKLQEENVKVIFGVGGLKVHSKLFLITRKENNTLVNYAHIGTGNFHEGTAKVYTDHTLLTSDKRITNDVVKIFDFFEWNYKTSVYRHLIVSPFYMRSKFYSLINNEIRFAKQGKPASFTAKLNSLSDPEMTKKIYEASKAGVKITLIVRGICSVIPGIKGLSENIEAYSLVDRFLEHTRIYIFNNGGNPLHYIASADWMTRNLDKRTEVACPIYDKNLQKELNTYIEIQKKGNVKVRLLNAKPDNKYKPKSPKEENFRVQYELYNYFRKKIETKKDIL